MSAEPSLFKTPSLEDHLQTLAIATLDAGLADLNVAGRITQDPGGFAVLSAEWVSRLRIADVPTLEAARLTYENLGNRQLIVHLPFSGRFELLTFQVQRMPPPTLVGTLIVDAEARQIILTYDVKPGPKSWDAALDGDLAMLRAYLAAMSKSIALFHQQLGALVETKIRETMHFNEVRCEIAEKMERRGFRELEPLLAPVPTADEAEPHSHAED